MRCWVNNCGGHISREEYWNKEEESGVSLCDFASLVEVLVGSRVRSTH